MKKYVFLFSFIFFLSCSENEDNSLTQMGRVAEISRDYTEQSLSVKIPTQLNEQDIICNLRHDSYWINDILASKEHIKFHVELNSDRSKGYRSDTIDLFCKGVNVGYIEVYQARHPMSLQKLTWGPDILLSLPKGDGKKETEMLYHFCKNSDGRYSLSDFPAFAYCIEMNHNPEKNMEWYLPSERSEKYREVSNNNYPFDFWSSTEYSRETVDIRKWASNNEQHLTIAAFKNDRFYVYAVR